MKNYEAIARWQPIYPDRCIGDVAIDIGGGVQIVFEDGSIEVYDRHAALDMHQCCREHGTHVNPHRGCILR